jgi:oligoribonuclease
MPPPLSPTPDRLVWMDLEMTGLDPDACHILEIATVVTDGQLDPVAEGPVFVIHQDEAALESLSAWSRQHFGASGLLERVRASPVTLAAAEAGTLDFLRGLCTPRSAPLCGNSIHMDRAFLRRHMRALHDFLHYRNVDVSTVKELVQRWYPAGPPPPMKRGLHQALADVRESLAELRHYRERFFVP